MRSKSPCTKGTSEPKSLEPKVSQYADVMNDCNTSALLLQYALKPLNGGRHLRDTESLSAAPMAAAMKKAAGTRFSHGGPERTVALFWLAPAAGVKNLLPAETKGRRRT